MASTYPKTEPLRRFHRRLLNRRSFEGAPVSLRGGGRWWGALLAGVILSSQLTAAFRLPAIFGDHMVLQQQQRNPLWGWDTPGTSVTVTIGGRTYSATAGADGRWSVSLEPMPASFTPREIAVRGSESRTVKDVLVGEVWMCSGQSNMAFPLREEWNGDLEAAASRLPGMRLLRVKSVGAQEPRDDIEGAWSECTPESARGISAVGFLFGRYIHQIVGVPVGVIDNSWGASNAEAWMRRSALENDPRFRRLIATTAQTESHLQSAQGRIDHEAKMAKWRVASDAAVREGREAPRPPMSPERWLSGQMRTGNIFNGVVLPTRGYGIRGVLWYQGEGNSTRAHEHAELFPFLIEQWRREWNQGDFPFYWVQLPNYKPQRTEPQESAWAELRETQTKALRLPHTGQAVTIDLGEGKAIHPRNKHDVAARLVRWALVKEYGLTLPYRSPEFRNVAFAGNKATIELECFGSKLRPFGVEEAIGFAVCGADRVWRWATGKMVGANRIEVWSAAVEKPVAVRYAWADNPACNLFSEDGLPVTPFRTDDFARSTMPKP